MPESRRSWQGCGALHLAAAVDGIHGLAHCSRPLHPQEVPAALLNLTASTGNERR